MSEDKQRLVHSAESIDTDMMLLNRNIQMFHGAANLETFL